MIGPDRPLLVLGIGNTLLRDDGIGVDVVRSLERLQEGDEVTLPTGTRIADGGTLGLGLLPLIAGSRAMVLVDAVDVDRDPGHVVVIRGDALRGARVGGHPTLRTGVAELLAAAAGAGVLPPAVSLVGIQAARIGIGLERTPAVTEAVPAAVEATIAELWRIGASRTAADRPPAAARRPRGAAA